MLHSEVRALLKLLFLTFVAAITLPRSHAAGVTLITHGLNGDIDGWVSAMAQRTAAYRPFPGTNATRYELYFIPGGADFVLTWRRVAGPSPLATDSGEIIIAFDWRQLANNDYSTYDVAARVAPALLQTNFISELNGRALAELPLHLVGHSRGGSLVCELSRLLGINGVWVDHLTTLDPHPLNNDGFVDFPYTIVDAPARTYENVLFHDNYFQDLNVIAYGEPVFGAYVRQLTNLDGGYGGFTASHSDVHLWYHGTIDLRVPASDTEASITSAERQAWWTLSESRGALAGFHYSRIGGGNRLATNRPAGAGTARVRDGFNQVWDLGAGVSSNRTLLPSNDGAWPNPIRFNLSGTNLFAFGQTNFATLYYQWGQPGISNATLTIHFDADFNPYNGNEHPILNASLPGTGPDNVNNTTATFVINGTNAPPGVHLLCAKLTAANRTRYLYAPEILTVFSSFQPPTLTVAQSTNNQVHVDVHGLPGQRAVVQETFDLVNWQPVVTNWLTTNLWRLSRTPIPNTQRFYRAALQ
jgi:hypothetical protein